MSIAPETGCTTNDSTTKSGGSLQKPSNRDDAFIIYPTFWLQVLLWRTNERSVQKCRILWPLAPNWGPYSYLAVIISKSLVNCIPFSFYPSCYERTLLGKQGFCVCALEALLFLLFPLLWLRSNHKVSPLYSYAGQRCSRKVPCSFSSNRIPYCN